MCLFDLDTRVLYQMSADPGSYDGQIWNGTTGEAPFERFFEFEKISIVPPTLGTDPVSGLSYLRFATTLDGICFLPNTIVDRRYVWSLSHFFSP